MNQIAKAMILGAGYGLRARPLSLVRPKPLFPVMNRPMISLTIERLQRLGIERIVVNTHHLADQMEAYLKGLNIDFNLITVYEPEILGTGGGLKNAAAHLGSDPFVLFNGDVFIDFDLEPLLRDHLAHRPLATLLLHDFPRFNQVAVDREGLVKGFRVDATDHKNDLSVLAFTGIHLVDPNLFDFIPEGPSDIITIYQAVIDLGLPIRAYIPERTVWWDAGTLADYLGLHASLASSPENPRIIIGPGVRIQKGARIEGWAFLGENAVVESNALVRESVFWPGARAAAGVTVQNCVLADGATAETDVRDAALVRETRI